VQASRLQPGVRSEQQTDSPVLAFSNNAAHRPGRSDVTAPALIFVQFLALTVGSPL
jgi:hypothetical protein